MSALEHAVVLLHFQSARAQAAVAALPARERAMVLRVDRRAFAADGERRARAVSVILEELPVSAAVVGARALFSFFDDAAFEAVVRGADGLVPAAARWLEREAGDFAVLEGAVARARRRRPAPPQPGFVALAPGVALCAVSDGALAAYGEARASLGPAPHERVAHGARVARRSATAEREHVLVQAGALSRVSAPLFDVLASAERPVARAAAERAATLHGADADEARALVDELIADGLVRAL